MPRYDCSLQVKGLQIIMRPLLAPCQLERLRSPAATLADCRAALEQLLNTVDDYGGLPTQQMTSELINAMRSKRTAAQAQGDKAWDGITEEAYNKLMRSVDPWRTTELNQHYHGSDLSESSARLHVRRRSVLAYIAVYG